MAAFVIYIIRWAVTLTLLYPFYGLLLRKETFHRFNRAVLVSILALSMLLPLCEVETSRPTSISVQMERLENSIMPMDLVMEDGPQDPTITDGTPGAIPTEQDASRGMSVGKVLIMVYLTGSLALLIQYLLSLVSLLRIISTSRLEERRDGMEIRTNSRLSTPMQLDALDNPQGKDCVEREPHDMPARDCTRTPAPLVGHAAGRGHCTPAVAATAGLDAAG